MWAAPADVLLLGPEAHVWLCVTARELKLLCGFRSLWCYTLRNTDPLWHQESPRSDQKCICVSGEIVTNSSCFRGKNRATVRCYGEGERDRERLTLHWGSSNQGTLPFNIMLQSCLISTWDKPQAYITEIPVILFIEADKMTLNVEE
jgi:hypothetical protein